MWIPYKMITAQTRDEKFHDILAGYYEDFKRFIQFDNLPKYITRPIINPIDTTVFSVTMPKDDVTPYIFNINKERYIRMGQGSLSGIYHEFTHIYDDIHFLLGYPKRRISIIPYTEFHATIVQMMIATGYTSYYSDKTISLNNKIVDGMHNCKLKEYLDRELQYNRTKLSVDYSNLKESFNYLYMLLIYHIGKMYFTQKYVKEDCSHLFSLEPFANIFGDKVWILKELLLKNNSSDEHMLYLSKVQNDIMQEFGVRYDKPSLDEQIAIASSKVQPPKEQNKSNSNQREIGERKH